MLYEASYGKPYALAEQLLWRAQVTNDPALLMYAQYALGFTSFCMGEFLLAREHLEMTITLYDLERHRPLTVLYGFDVGVNCLAYAAFTLWGLGYPDQALKRVNEALALAQGLSRPVSLTFAEGCVALVRQYRREVRAVQENAESAIALAVERGVTEVLPIVTALRGWAMAEQGRHEEGIAQIQEGLAALRATGSEWPVDLCLLAEACMNTDRLDDGLRALTEALAAADEHEIRNYEAEMHWLKGELLIKQAIKRCGSPALLSSERSRLRVSRAPNHWSCGRR